MKNISNRLIFQCIWVLSLMVSLIQTSFLSNPFHIQIKGITFTDDKYCPQVPYSSEDSDYSLQQLASTGANWVSIVVTFYQEYHNSTVIFPLYSPVQSDYYTYVSASDSSLFDVIKKSHKLGLKVMLKPHIDITNDDEFWRGDIGTGFTAEQWDEWFESYTRFILHFANMAERHQVEMLSVSCELIEASDQTEHWINVISKIRTVYQGILTDSSNWGYLDSRGGEDTHKKWWGYVDVIGIDAYYPIASNITAPSLEQIVEGWNPVIARFKNLTQFFNKPIMISEIGYCSGLCSRTYTPVAYDFKIQALYYQGAFEAFKNVDFPFLGYFWWSWNTDPRNGGDDDNCITPQYKPAEEVLREYYGGKNRLPKPPGQPRCLCTV